LRERREIRLRPRIVFVEPHRHADAPHAVALLRTRRERPSSRAAERSDEFAPSKPNAHVPILGREPCKMSQACGPYFRTPAGGRLRELTILDTLPD
jgi:hypothetical protein